MIFIFIEISKKKIENSSSVSYGILTEKEMTWQILQICWETFDG